MKTFADKVIEFNKNLSFTGKLPEGISIMNPFKENAEIIPISSSFYKKYYNDYDTRYLILGINPGRFGAGLTGIPFTDPKRLQEKCNIYYNGNLVHELSSVFVYDFIDAYGGIDKFYKKFYINSVCPLGFTKTNNKGKEVNCNYYDYPVLQNTLIPFIEWNIKMQIEIGCKTDFCFCLGSGDNYKFLLDFNNSKHFFQRIIPLEHPRYIMQYKLSKKENYIKDYIIKLNSIN